MCRQPHAHNDDGDPLTIDTWDETLRQAIHTNPSTGVVTFESFPESEYFLTGLTFPDDQNSVLGSDFLLDYNFSSNDFVLLLDFDFTPNSGILPYFGFTADVQLDSLDKLVLNSTLLSSGINSAGTYNIAAMLINTSRSFSGNNYTTYAGDFGSFNLIIKERSINIPEPVPLALLGLGLLGLGFSMRLRRNQ